ncbi:preprotein translocase subunit SecY [Mycoplasma sp. 2704]|uniref:preprotein translocase subunit SecY n=1 Tax=unclassified Mycoplasma TaxID=2683645 RepID=UPI002B1D97BE|nr:MULTISPECIES: preprotein translocase subunit SecY [unclassified Mycoplasma]MEA4134579.1 preprotein translocase subunit SecY [Mycoplasma sp. 2704]MEA4333684.1 preprotein translocase subunit SecY [Mycoplasma sp. 1232]
MGNLIYKTKNRLRAFFTNKDLTKKAIFTLLMLAIYILGTTITLPFVKIKNEDAISSNSFLNTLNLIGGGGLRQFSLFALGISPFINASLIMMILQSKIFPPIYKLSQSGPQGRRKINIITRLLTIVIAYPQAVFLIKTLGNGNSQFIELDGYGIVSKEFLTFFMIPMVLTSASLFALFISEQITNKGIGNGTSLIIFTGIAARLPFQFKEAFLHYIGVDLSGSSGALVGIVNFFTYILVYLLVLMIIAIVYVAERHIPIQQIGAGRSKSKKDIGFLPIKLNPAGIMPIIFAMMVLSFPTMIANILPDDNASKQWINQNMQFTQPIGFTLLIVVIFAFSLVMGIQQSKVDKIAEDFAKNSTFIPGVRPGEETQDYLIGIVFRLSVFSSFYLLALGSMQFVEIMAGILPSVISFGGTGLMILVSVALETVGQLQARIKSNNLSKAKRESIKNIESNSAENVEGLLW